MPQTSDAVRPGDLIAAVDMEEVESGDLIRADFIIKFIHELNRIISEVNSLNKRLTTLESGTVNNVLIKNIFPKKARVGDILFVEGLNFIDPPEDNTVTINNWEIDKNRFRGDCSETLITFKIPSIPDIPPAGDDHAVLRVSNHKFGTAAMPFELLPELDYPKGRIAVSYIQAPIAPMDTNTGKPIIVPGEYIFTFSVTAFVDKDSTYNISANVVNADTEGWKAELLEKNSNNVRRSEIISLPGDLSGATSREDIRIRLTAPNEADGTKCSLRFEVTDISGGNQVTPGNQQLEITIGDFLPLPSENIELSLHSHNYVTIEDNRIKLTRNNNGDITFNILVKQEGQYTVTPVFRQATGWQITDPESIHITSGGEYGLNKTVNFIIRPDEKASDTELVVTVTSADSQKSVSFVQQVVAV